MKHTLPGLSKMKGDQQGYTLLPPGEYLMEVQGLKVQEKYENNADPTENPNAKHIAWTYRFRSKVLNGQNLPPTVAIENYLGKTFFDSIYIMTPEHPKYNDPTDSGKVGDIGLNTLKAFLNTLGVKVTADGFNDKACEGKQFEVLLAVQGFTKRDGTPGKPNSVVEYRKADEESGGVEDEEVMALPDDGSDFVDDLLDE